MDSYYNSRQGQNTKRAVIRVIEGESKDRIFKNWSMGFKLMEDDLRSLEGFQDVELFFDEHKKTESASLVMIFLRLFYEKNIVDYPEVAA